MEPTELEKILLAAADAGDAGNLPKRLAQIPPLVNEKSNQAGKLGEAVALLLSSQSKPSKALVESCIQLARIKVPGTALRQALGSQARALFPKWPDATGLDAALGLSIPGTEITHAGARLNLLALLLHEHISPELSLHELPPKGHKFHVYNSNFGFGRVEAVDAGTGSVTTVFKAKQNIALQQFAEKSHLVVPGSLAQKLLEGAKIDVASCIAADLAAELELCFVPHLKISQALLTRLLMPNYIKSVKAFETWFARKRAANTAASSAAAPASAASAAASARASDSARTLAELKDLLASAQSVSAAQLESLGKLFDGAGDKEAQKQIFAETLATLGTLCPDAEAFAAFAKRSDKALLWKDVKALFILADKLPARLAPALTSAAVAAMGRELLLKGIIEIPIRYWDPLALALGDSCEEDLLAAVASASKSGDCSPDAICWLWNRFGSKRQAELGPVIGSSQLILRVIAKKGDTKAGKDLRKILLDDEKFQRFLMGDGQAQLIRELVSSVRSLPGLDSGEKQSLLVRVVRLFPQHKNLVEEKSVSVAVRSLEKVTSMRSYNEKRVELDDITRNQIPANSEAIARARDHGDLRENFEFKAAKEKQKFLSIRKGELESMLNEVRPTDFSEFPLKDRVVPGCVVTLKVNDKNLVYTVLGLWDSDPEKLYISFDTPLGKTLMGRAVGDAIDLPDGSEATIAKLEALSPKLLAELAN
ncbi:MAG: hypothetical protein RL095_3263 [Verrucomicrobiota bacterium]|jgi:transcription elongation GreA/GreB family factor